MSTTDGLRQSRLEKLRSLRSLGVDPYPYRFQTTHSAGEIDSQAETLIADNTQVKVAGRLIALRAMGRAAFGHIKDRQERIQFYIRKDAVTEDCYAAFCLCDLGDYVGLSGVMMRTRTGALSLRVQQLTVLSKALRPLPVMKVEQREEGVVRHDEVRDVEFRYRQRYAHMAVDDQVAQVFIQRTRILEEIRGYLNDAGFLEVETPILQPIYGGAACKPFTTRHEALGMPLYLRVATELYLKRLVAGGLDRVYEIGKDFRNEGLDRSHNPEFTMLEFYQAYADYTDIMAHFERICSRCAERIHGKTRIVFQGQEIDLTPPWPRMSMEDALAQYAGIHFSTLDDSDLQTLLGEDAVPSSAPLPSGGPSSKAADTQTAGAQRPNSESKPTEFAPAAFTREAALVELFETRCAQQLIQPTFIVGFPRSTTPLCKADRDNPEFAERSEPYIVGWEFGNLYSELNDPQEQQALLEAQAESRRQGLEGHPYDADFIRAMEYGMPPMGGAGLGIDRLVMLLTDQPSIRDVLLFPIMRPEQR